MTPERIAAIRRYIDEGTFDNSIPAECLDEIERLQRVRADEVKHFEMLLGQWRGRVDAQTGLRTEQAKRALALQDMLDAEQGKSASLTKVMMEVAASIRVWASTPTEPIHAAFKLSERLESALAATYGKAERMCHPLCARETDHETCQVDREWAAREDAAEAAKYVPTTTLPLSPANQAVAEEMARELLDEPLPIPVVAVDPEADALVDRLLSAARAKAKPPEPEPMRPAQPQTVVTGGTFPLVMSKGDHDTLVNALAEPDDSEPASPIARRIVAAERSRRCMDCGGEAKPAFGAGYRPDAPVTLSMVVCRACRDKMVAAREPRQPEPERCNAMHAGERCIKTRGHDGWHQTPGNVHIIWPDPEPHEPASKEKRGCAQHDVRTDCCCCDRYAFGQQREELLVQVERLTKERDEWHERAQVYNRTHAQITKERDEARQSAKDSDALSTYWLRQARENNTRSEQWRTEYEKLRGELAASLVINEAWRKQSAIVIGDGIQISGDPRVPRGTFVADSMMPPLPGEQREIDQLRNALKEMHSNYERALELELDYEHANGDDETRIDREIDALTRRNAHLLEVCGVKP